MRQLLRVVGTIVVLLLLVAVVVGAAQNLPAAPEQGQAALTTAESRQQVEDTVTVCVILIGGTALLAGMLWVKRLRSSSDVPIRNGRWNEPPIRSGDLPGPP